jgi:uncharacterized protein (PEP-CTERM system associated)
MATATVPRSRRYDAGALISAALAISCSGPALAADARWAPSLTVTETLTNNADLSPTPQHAEWITDGEAQLQTTGSTARANWTFDYQRHELAYSRSKARDTAQNILDAAGTIEGVEKRLYVDARGSVSQQAISAFAPQSPDRSSIDANRSETGTYELSPYLRGNLASAADYEVRGNFTHAHSSSNVLGNARSREWITKLNGRPAGAALLWSAEAGSLTTAYNDGSSIRADHLRGTVGAQVDPQLRLSLIAGREANDYLTPAREWTNTRGFGVDWMPSQTTKISGSREKRFFGDGHSVSLTHRTQLSAWQYSDRKDAAVLPGQFGQGSIGNIYDLLSLMNESRIPDPVQRDLAVRQYLAAMGISANAQVVSGFLSSSARVERAQQASFALLGTANTVTFAATRDEQQSISKMSNLLGDFASSSDILQRGASVTWTHKLSPTSTLAMAVAGNRSSALAGGLQETRLRRLDVSFATRLGPRTAVGLGARRVRANSSGSGEYAETAIIGTITLEF